MGTVHLSIFEPWERRKRLPLRVLFNSGTDNRLSSGLLPRYRRMLSKSVKSDQPIGSIIAALDRVSKPQSGFGEQIICTVMRSI